MKQFRLSLAGMGIILFLILFLFLSLGDAETYRTIKRNTDLSHVSGKIGKYTALIIGIDDYEDADIPDLKTAAADAESVADILKNLYGFQDIILLKNRAATKSAMVTKFRNCIRDLGTDDNLLIYYAGHGELDRLVEGNGWWVPSDAKAGDITSYIENTTVQSYLRAMKARHVLMVSDSCYSGTLFGESRALPGEIGDQFYLDLYNEKSRWGMTSGNKTPVSDRGSRGHSVFAYQFIRKLEKNRKPYLTPREIYTDIGPVVRNNSEQMPLCRPVKMTGDMGGEFVFILAASSGGGIIIPKKETTLKVTANVRGAVVWVDDRKYGEVPITLKVRPGPYKIRVGGLDDYEDYEKKRIHVAEGEEYEVKAYLEKIDRGPKPGEIWKEPVTGMEFIWVTEGCFQMGDISGDGDSDEKPVHEVCVDGFYMGKYEVTQGEWEKIMGDNPASFKNGNNYPVDSVSWDDVKDFIKKLKSKNRNAYEFRLPTEAEWEYAARSGGKKEKFAGFSDESRLYQYGNFCDKNCEYDWKDEGQNDKYEKTSPVGTYKPNGLGLYDMSGNLWEWCEDTYADDAYRKHQRMNPLYTGAGSDRVIRGGSWSSYARNCRSAHRDRHDPSDRYGSVGFRLAFSPGQ